MSKIKQYGKYIKGYEFDDLMNEGFVVALEAANKWKGKKDSVANTFAWAWLQIDCRFKELAKIGYRDECSLDEMDEEISDELVDNVIGDFFGTTQSTDYEAEKEEKFEICLEEAKKIFQDSPEKYYKFLSLMVETNCCPVAIASQLKVSNVRISQIVKKFKSIMDNHPPIEKAA